MSNFDLRQSIDTFTDNSNKLSEFSTVEINTMANIANEQWQQSQFSAEVTRASGESPRRDEYQVKVEQQLYEMANNLATINRLYNGSSASEYQVQRQNHVALMKGILGLPNKTSAEQVLSMDTSRIYSILVQKYKIGSPGTDHKAIYESMVEYYKQK